MKHKLITGIIVVAVLALAFFQFGGPTLFGAAQSGTGPTQYQPWNFLQGLYAGTLGQFHVSNNGTIFEGTASIVDSSGILTGVIGASTHKTLTIATSTVLAGAWDCQTDTVIVTTSTAAITITLPPATSTAAACLTQDGTQEFTIFNIAAGNAFNTTLASSTGDILVWNTTSTSGGNVLSTSSAGSYYKLDAYRFSPTSVVYTIGSSGNAH